MDYQLNLGPALRANEAAVVAHHPLGLQLAHRVQRHADHNQDGGARDCQALDAGDGANEEWQYGDNAEEQDPTIALPSIATSDLARRVKTGGIRSIEVVSSRAIAARRPAAPAPMPRRSAA